MKIQIGMIVTLMLIVGFARTAQATTLSDNFNDGNADGWIAAAPCSATPYCAPGNWRVENGQVIQDQGGDDAMFLLNNYNFSDQTVQVNFLRADNSYDGIALWYQDADNWVNIYAYYADIYVLERWCSGPCDRDTNVVATLYPYSNTVRTWHTMKVEANSLTGQIAVYLDGVYQFTHTVGPNIHRSGLTGLVSGNGGGIFDDFSVTWPDPVPTNKNQCINNGWKSFINPSFKNQGACINFVSSKK